jgi:hypothetical protein
MQDLIEDGRYVLEAAEQLCVGRGEAYRNGVMDALDYELGVFSRRLNRYDRGSVDCDSYHSGREAALLFLDRLRSEGAEGSRTQTG